MFPALRLEQAAAPAVERSARAIALRSRREARIERLHADAQPRAERRRRRSAPRPSRYAFAFVLVRFLRRTTASLPG